MLLQELVERFEKQAPVCSMLRAALENVLSAERLNALFDEVAERQENKELLFSTVADVMGLVALRIHPSVHAAYQTKRDEMVVTVKALYDKLQRMEPNISRQLVRDTAGRMQEIIHKSKGSWPQLIPGYRAKIIDGNHLRRTEHRLQELRQLDSAPLPGHCLVVLDPETKLAVDVFPCEDAYAQERSLLPAVLETIEPRDALIADRNFCTTDFLWGIKRRKAYFLIRQHASTLHWELTGRRKKAGLSETGIVYEQPVQLFDAEGNCTMLRRITVELVHPTRDGDRELHLLTNLPSRIGAVELADLYRQRWTIETAFQEVAENLEGEIKALGYPRAALFSFCTALVAFNLLSVIRASFRAAHPAEETKRDVSIYYLCDEVSHTHRGLEIAIPATYWKRKYATMTPARLARELVRIAQGANLSHYQKHQRGPNKRNKPVHNRPRAHVSTARILEGRKVPDI